MNEPVMTDDSTKRAILLLNLGGPETLDDVRPFLYRLFSDPEVIRVGFGPLRKLIAGAISATRRKTSQTMYARIGGGSPIRKLTDLQAEGLGRRLEQDGKKAAVRTAFTCSPPLVEDVVRDLAREGVRRFLSFPLYPQYSYTTTKGSLDRVRAAVRRYAPGAQLSEICAWPTQPKFLAAHAALIRDQAIRFSDPRPKAIHLLFSAHSIPEKLVTEQGDPYRDQMEQTVHGIVETLGWTGPWSLAWQSRLGPIRWIGPATPDAIAELGRKGVRQVLVDPVAFVTDHIETLYEIDMLFGDAARQAGILEFRRALGLNDHPLFLDALADLARAQVEFWS
jgi:protoporphyrin/coproporphyrin ferrochelatase